MAGRARIDRLDRAVAQAVARGGPAAERALERAERGELRRLERRELVADTQAALRGTPGARRAARRTRTLRHATAGVAVVGLGGTVALVALGTIGSLLAVVLAVLAVIVTGGLAVLWAAAAGLERASLRVHAERALLEVRVADALDLVRRPAGRADDRGPERSPAR